MKQLSFILGLLLSFSISVNAQTFAAKDIEGLWQNTKKGAELFIDVNGSKATITSVGSSGLTKNIEGGYLYEGIRYVGNGIWKAQRNAWIYNGVGGVNSDKGRWEKAKEPELTLTLSQDNNTLTAAGHWTFKRVKPHISTSPDGGPGSETVTEDFGGLLATFRAVNKANGGSLILGQFINRKTGYTAHMEITTADGTVYTEELSPGSTLTKKYATNSMDVQVQYKPATGTQPSKGMIETIKEMVHKKVTNPDGKIRVWSTTSVGVRG